MSLEPVTLAPWTIFISAVIVALAGAAVKGVFQVVHSLKAMSRSLDALVIADQKQTLAIGMLAKLQRPQLAAHKATLEAVRDGRCNGNVTSAHSGVLQAFTDFDEFLTGRI
jgi:hypothetical protein